MQHSVAYPCIHTRAEKFVRQAVLVSCLPRFPTVHTHNHFRCLIARQFVFFLHFCLFLLLFFFLSFFFLIFFPSHANTFSFKVNDDCSSFYILSFFSLSLSSNLAGFFFFTYPHHYLSFRLGLMLVLLHHHYFTHARSSINLTSFICLLFLLYGYMLS